ncbi:MAG: hypothetical protein ABL973_19215 [Micropepsaceae bacterium]
MKKMIIALGLLVVAGGLVRSVPVAQAGQNYAECVVVDVATFNNRVHLNCSAPLKASDLVPGASKGKQGNGISYYAVEVGSPMASHVIQIGLAAVASHHTLGIFYDDNAGANPAGCNSNDCRRLIGVVYK